jgi:uncharacterized membrane protein HdeD (DUF308 family)
MLQVMSRNWWMVLIQGIAAVLFGIAILFTWPGLVVQTMILVFAVYVFVDGIFAVINAIQNRNSPRWWVMLLEGAIGILAGIAAFLFPGGAVLTLLYIVAFWSVFTGLTQIITAVQLRKEIDNEWWLILSGIASMIFGFLIVLYPGAAVLTILNILGILAIIWGVMLVLLAFRLRNAGGSSSGTGSAQSYG